MCAKTWAFATGCTLVGVDTFEAAAERLSPGISHVDVIADALRGDLYHGQYEQREGRWTLREPIHIVSAENWLRTLPPNRAVAG
ncbi:hypothetical protein OVW19_28965, partial [Klebsiella pneumoniae]|uniref:hypothetical protein n=1 Tax=Klebsiella pneumoniae TaxID=573 RepID=UPI00226EE77F